MITNNEKYYWVDVSHEEVEKSLKILLRKVSQNRKNLGKKKISSQTHIMKEFVVNLDRHHKPHVMQKIANYLERYNFTILQKSLHFDEGVFVEKLNVSAKDWKLDDYIYDSDRKKWINKNGKVVLDIIVYQPSVNIFFDEKSQKWYHDREYKRALDMTTVKKKINFHGHLLVFNLNNAGNSIARTLRPHLSQIQKDIASITGMHIKPKNNKRKGEKHMDYKNSAALSAKEDEMKRKHISLYNQNQMLIKKFGELDPKILKTKNVNERFKLIKNVVGNFKNWKKFAINQYVSFGFPYSPGDAINIVESVKIIEQKLDAEKKFIEDAFKIFNIKKGTSLPDAIKKIEGHVQKQKEPVIKSLL